MRCTSLLAAFVLHTCLLSPLFAGENWPEFRGPTGDGHSDARDLPTKWSEKENVRWKTAIHGKGWSSPVIWERQIWLTTAPTDGKELYAVCVDRDSGKMLHDIKVFDVPKPAFCHAFNSYASPTPAIEAGRVYVHFGSAGTACVDTATGKVLWERRDLPCDHWRGAGSSPILYGDLLILTFDGYDYQYLVALNKKDGKTVWKKDRDIDYHMADGDLKKAYATPRVVEVEGKPQMICPSAEATVAYNPLTGEEIWRVIHGGMNASARPVIAQGHVYLTSGHTGRLLSVRLGGKGNITKSHVDWIYTKTVPSRPSLLQAGDYLFMVSDKGFASCVEARTGTEIKKLRLNGDFSASPLYAEGRIYCFSQDGPGYVLEANRNLTLLATNELSAGCMASPAVAGKALYVRTKTHLYRLEK